MLADGREVINIDESSIDKTNYIRKGWGDFGYKLFSAESLRLEKIHIIAAVSSRGRGWFIVGYGNNNGNTSGHS